MIQAKRRPTPHLGLRHCRITMPTTKIATSHLRMFSAKIIDMFSADTRGSVECFEGRDGRVVRLHSDARGAWRACPALTPRPQPTTTHARSELRLRRRSATKCVCG